jgi:transcriptional regulator with XRE-family HTH domain
VNAQVNVPRILQGMKAKGWGIQATCAFAGVNNRTLKKILNGEVPIRLDAFYRLIDGLNIPIGEAIINGGTYQKAQGPRLRVVSGGRSKDS